MNKLLSTFFFIIVIIYTAVYAQSGPGLFCGSRYNILPVSHGLGGGLTTGNIGSNFSCPLYVVQKQLDTERGLPVRFSSWNAKQCPIGWSYTTIQFSTATICVNSNVWMIDWDESISRYVIATNGVRGPRTKETISIWFNIQRYETDYKIVYCPTFCATCKTVCGDLGVFVKDGKRILVVNENSDDVPLRVRFQEIVETGMSE